MPARKLPRPTQAKLPRKIKKVKNKDTKDGPINFKGRATLKVDRILTASVIAIVGTITGFVLHKCQLTHFQIIQDQFRFKRFTLLKFLLSAAATVNLVSAFFSITFPTQFQFARNKFRSVSNVFGCVVGGLLLGAGFAYSGTNCALAIGLVASRVDTARTSVTSILVGCLIFGLIEPLIRKYFSKTHFSYIDNYLKMKFLYVSVGMACLLFACAFGLEVILPWKHDVVTELLSPSSRNPPINSNTYAQQNANSTNSTSFPPVFQYQTDDLSRCFLSCFAWHPIICGILFGLLHFPVFFVFGTVPSASTGFISVSGQWIRFEETKTRDYYTLFKNNLDQFWQMVYLAGLGLGTFLSTTLTNDYKWKTVRGGPKEGSLVGGLLLIVGARLAKGSAHTLCVSGLGMLSLGSCIVFLSMLVGGSLALMFVDAFST